MDFSESPIHYRLGDGFKLLRNNIFFSECFCAAPIAVLTIQIKIFFYDNGFNGHCAVVAPRLSARMQLFENRYEIRDRYSIPNEFGSK